MTDLYDPGPTLLSKYWQFMRLCVRARACVCAHVHFKVISVMISGNVRAPVCVRARVHVHFKVISVRIGDDCHCKQGVVSIYYNHLNPKYLNRLYHG